MSNFAQSFWKIIKRAIWTFVRNKDREKLKNKKRRVKCRLLVLWSSLTRGVLRYYTCTQHIQWVLKKLLSICIWLIQPCVQSSTPTESTAVLTSFSPIMLSFLCFDIIRTTESFRKATSPFSKTNMKMKMIMKWSIETECPSTDGLTRTNIKTKTKLS